MAPGGVILGPGGYLHPQPPPHGIHPELGIPLTLAELERHYAEMGEQRSRMVALLDKTDRMMAGLKRGIDDMQSGGGPSQPEPQGGQQAQQKQPDGSEAPSVPLSRAEKDRSRESVWPVNKETGTSRE
jgi:hypothetical protein